MKFIEEHDAVTIQDKTATNAIADLLQVEPHEVEKALCSRVVAARGDVVVKGHNTQEALHGKDAFAKVSSYNIFDRSNLKTKTSCYYWLCIWLNEKKIVQAVVRFPNTIGVMSFVICHL